MTHTRSASCSAAISLQKTFTIPRWLMLAALVARTSERRPHHTATPPRQVRTPSPHANEAGSSVSPPPAPRKNGRDPIFPDKAGIKPIFFSTRDEPSRKRGASSSSEEGEDVTLMHAHRAPTDLRLCASRTVKRVRRSASPRDPELLDNVLEHEEIDDMEIDEGNEEGPWLSSDDA